MSLFQELEAKKRFKDVLKKLKYFDEIRICTNINTKNVVLKCSKLKFKDYCMYITFEDYNEVEFLSYSSISYTWTVLKREQIEDINTFNYTLFFKDEIKVLNNIRKDLLEIKRDHVNN